VLQKVFNCGKDISMQNLFNRKTFDPINNPVDLKTLNILRTYGRSRQSPSKALTWVALPSKGTFLDIGCGDSRDWGYAKRAGMTALRTDLFPPRVDLPQHGRIWEGFHPGDAAEALPFANESIDVAVSQAMLDLIEPFAREAFFQEVNRVLKSGGVFSCFIQWLQSGWGFDLAEEQERAIKVFGKIQKQSGGFTVTKE
jgi:SAM-dependent methyltransferase